MSSDKLQALANLLARLYIAYLDITFIYELNQFVK